MSSDELRPIKVICDKCKSENVKRTSGRTVDIFPGIFPFVCLDCKHEFHSQEEEWITKESK